MGIRSLNQLAALRTMILRLRREWLHRIHGIDLDPGSSISLSGRLRSGGPGSIVIGPETLIAFKTFISSVDIESGEVRPVRIGRRCFIGGGATILPGVHIGDESVIGAGAVVMEDVPPRSIVAGNPARVIRRDIKVGRFGRMEGADDNSRRLWR